MPRRYMPQIDGLRAVAAASVLYTHFVRKPQYFGEINFGWYGVRLFFVLSGFLLTTNLLADRQLVEAGASRVRLVSNFAVRRALRIFPLYYLILGLAALLNLPPIRETYPWHLFYLSNFYMALGDGATASASHLWSLAVEEQFYLVLPWLALFLSRRLLLPTAIGAVLVGPLYRFAATAAGLSFYAATTLTPGVLDSLGMGCLLALVQERGRHSGAFVRGCGVGGLVVLASVPWLSSATKFPASIVVVDLALAFVFTWMVARAADGFNGPFGKVLSLGPLVYLGKISYGIYLIHLFVPYALPSWLNKAATEASGGWSRAPSVLWLAVTIALAALSWRAFERPINLWKTRFAGLDGKEGNPATTANRTLLRSTRSSIS